MKCDNSKVELSPKIRRQRVQLRQVRTTRRRRFAPSLTPRRHVRLELAAEIARRRIVADEQVLAPAGGDTAAELGRGAPDHLGEMAGARREATGSEIVLAYLVVPALDLGVRRKGARRAHGQVLAKPVVGVAEVAGVRPLLGGGGKLRAPGKRGHAMLRPQLIVLVERNLGEIAALACGRLGLGFATGRPGFARLSSPATGPHRQHHRRLVARGHDDAEAVLLAVEHGEVVTGEGLHDAGRPRCYGQHRELSALAVVLPSAPIDPVDVKLGCTGILEGEAQRLRAVRGDDLSAQLAAGTRLGIGRSSSQHLHRR